MPAMRRCSPSMTPGERPTGARSSVYRRPGARLFESARPVRRLRNLALLAFDVLPPAKAALSRLSTGAGGRIPKLARGVPLQ
jgi:hypothetical protein